jgi:ABC-type multidrug transport system ATPase subunit
MGYVPQEDVMHRDLTVYEVLYYAAKMRLPGDLPDEKVVETVERVLTRMGLAHIKNSIIGDEQVRGVSGGQRKRVNIALELLTEPKIIYLDEPTSGLDATSTLDVLQILRSLANTGTTIILTIHQPRVEAYRLIDNVILLVAGGKLAYYGPAYPDAPDYFSGFFPKYAYKKGNNPADYILDMLELNKAVDHFDWQNEFLQSPYYTRFVQNRLSQRKDLRQEQSRHTLAKRSGLIQFVHLFSRYSIRKLRDRSSLLIQLLQTPVIGGILAWLFWKEGYGITTQTEITAFKHEGLLNLIQLQNGVHPTIFLIAAAAFWFGCSNVAREIVSERAIYLREKRTGLRSGAYISSIFAYQFLLASIQTLFIAIIIWPTLELTANFFLGWAILTLIASCGISLGLLVSASSKTEVTAISTIPLLLLPQLMMGGFVKLYGELVYNGLQDHFSDLMPIRWAFEAMVNLEYQSLSLINENVRSIDNIIGFAPRSPLTAVIVLAFLTLLFLFLTQFRLQFLENNR